LKTWINLTSYGTRGFNKIWSRQLDWAE